MCFYSVTIRPVVRVAKIAIIFDFLSVALVLVRARFSLLFSLFKVAIIVAVAHLNYKVNVYLK